MFQAQEVERVSPGPRRQIESDAEELQGFPHLLFLPDTGFYRPKAPVITENSSYDELS